ncbi:unnamed protein product [Sordaria macrospora k-hell]|uniref:WGS project CABT00000000 data, contig 2.50 n=1 Tax=Sordaria macrospora (strain ATCC MYA-333 / DSM 997 / K(L3346) / K-hell) TaxID=771870 RepID=F7W9A1_SORMK|nr:uncharacterized protein SMAC_08048 [Sordaria macrospora k-hell]CCC05181.1 unnamed protein product [Sordaria macrospora k-hell]
MTIKPITTPLGQSLPPFTPHAITAHLPGWDTALRFRDGDPEIGRQLKSMYPRFSPLSLVKELCNNLLTHLGPDISTQTHGCLPFTTPDVFPLAATYCVSHHRGAEHRFTESDTSALLFRVVDFFNVPLIPDADSNSPGGGLTEKVRLYLVIYPLDKAKGIKGIWTDPGVGISTRLAEVLLPLVGNSEDPEQGSQEQFKVLEWSATASDFLPGSTTTTGPLTEKDVPPPTHLPESSAHEKLRERIVTLCQRLPRDPEIANRLTPNDVFLYTTGMAAVFRLQEALFKMGRKGPVVALGAVFHSTFHLFEELEGEAERSEDLNAEKGTEPKPTVGERTVEGGGQKVEGAKKEKVEGFKHFGNCEDSDKVMDELEEYCKGLRQKGQKVAYLFVEFPSNPLLVSVDLGRLRKIADEYDFPVVIDDTVGSFCNIDVLPVADVVVTSLTKTFSGYADVMAGSILLSPSSSYHTPFLSTLTTLHNNTLSPPDASHLLANSTSYLTRSATHNSNAQNLASLLHTYSNPTKGNESFTPGYGCLLSIDFPTKRIAQAFYDNLHVHQGPHLGAHLTIALPFNDLLWGAEEKVKSYHEGYGAVGEQVRVSVGLERWEELKEVFEEALGKAEEVAKEELAESEA